MQSVQKLLVSSLTFYFLYSSSHFGLHFTLTVCFEMDWPHFTCSLAASGWWWLSCVVEREGGREEVIAYRVHSAKQTPCMSHHQFLIFLLKANTAAYVLIGVILYIGNIFLIFFFIQIEAQYTHFCILVLFFHLTLYLGGHSLLICVCVFGCACVGVCTCVCVGMSSIKLDGCLLMTYHVLLVLVGTLVALVTTLINASPLDFTCQWRGGKKH